MPWSWCLRTCRALSSAGHLVATSVAAASSRKFPSSTWPVSREYRLRVELHALDGKCPVAQPMTIPSVVQAVTSKQSGTESASTTREWYRVAWNTSGGL